MPDTAKRTARVPILGEDGRISDDYIPAAIGENTAKAEAAATRAETAANSAEGSATAASQSATGAQGSASAASASATQAQQSATAASGAVTQAQSAQQAAEAAKTASETAQSAAAGSAQDAQQSATAAAQSAASVADKFIASAQATTLDPGAQATASVEDQVLTIGVPRGEKGDTGEQGPQGEPGQDGQDATLPEGMVVADENGNLSSLGSDGEPSTMMDIVVENTANGVGAMMNTSWISPSVSVMNSQTKAAVGFGLVDGEPVLQTRKSQSGIRNYGFSPTIPEDDALTVVTSDAYKADTDPLKQRIAELENQAANVVTGASTGLVSHGEDAYAQKPIEVRIKGKTWVNRWPVINKTADGVTVTTDETGLITISGEPTSNVFVSSDKIYSCFAAGKQYSFAVSNDLGFTASSWPYIEFYDSANVSVGEFALGGPQASSPLTVPAGTVYAVCRIAIYQSQPIAGSFRLMLVDGTEAPDCFTPPASITSVETGNLVTSGKNLLPTAGITDVGANNNATEYVDLLPGTYTISAQGGPFWQIIVRGDDNTDYSAANYNVSNATFTLNQPTRVRFLFWISGEIGIFASNPQLELGSTATPYEPPNVTTTPLPEVELRSLPNGTCDELVIKEDGTCEVERKLGEAVIDAEHPVTVSNVIPASGDNLPYAIVSNMVPPFVSPTAEPYSTEMHSTTWPYAPNLRSRGVYRTSQSVTFVDERFTDVETAQSIINETGGTFVAQVPSSTEPQSTVTLPTLPAPTFNQYHDADVPSDTSTEYVRDINIVLDNLAKQVAGAASAVAVHEASTIEEE